tara:strand:- start:41 stop:517 length:477 start_codon:yes stop_codon:yes gene_type:complete
MPDTYKLLKKIKSSPGTIESKVAYELGNPKKKAIANIKTRYNGDNANDDAPRHVTTSQYTTETLRNKLPFGLGNSIMGRGLAAFGANVLGAAHEAKAGYSAVKSGKASIKNTVLEGIEDLTNNLAGSVVGALGNSNMDKSKNKTIDKIVKYLPDGKYE